MKNYVAYAGETFHDLCYKGALQQLIKLGIENYPGKDPGSLRVALQILDKYDRQFRELIRDLADQGYLQVEKNGVVITSAAKKIANSFNLTASIKNALAGNPAYDTHINLLFSCLQSFENILRGKIPAIEVLFPNGSTNMVAGIYKNNPEADCFNDALCRLVKTTIDESLANLENDRLFTILEVGAGTGGTSIQLFEALKTHREHVRYIYTDLSKSFLLYAEDKYKSIAPNLETRLFNIEQSPEEQGIELGSCDMVIGANVVHATRDISTTLQNIKGVLKSGGILFMNEIAQTDIFLTVTFGLLDGWWLYEDNELRLEGSPGLSAKSWEKVLSENGYLNTTVFSSPEALSQQIILSQSDGEILVSGTAIVQPQQQTKTNLQHNNNNKPVQSDNNWLSEKLLDIAARTIKLPREEFKPEEAFSDLGFDSILGGQLVRNINEELHISLNQTDIFSYPNINSLTDYITNNFSDFNASVAEPEVKTTSHEKPKQTGIAIVGMSGAYGSARDLDALWEVLKEGKSLISEVPPDRWSLAEHYSADKEAENKTNCKYGSFLTDIDKFDPVFFKISGREAENMDPQHRLFLQHCWHALEDAGIPPGKLNGLKCSVYVGSDRGDYMQNAEKTDISAFWGTSSSILAARISYLLNLKGPAVAINTACSSSLVAMDIACKSLLQGDTDLVLCGGSSINVTPDFYKLASKSGMLSEDGMCYAFDHRANGFVPGEGVGVIVLKRLEDAERNGDRIYATIKAIGTNQDGTTNGITAPSVLSQEQLEKELYRKYDVDPGDITYIEAHGTGTRLGDPIEFEALKKAFSNSTAKKQFCALGSVKMNIGHTLYAAGIAGIHKVLLSFKHQVLPPSVDFEKPNPLLPIEDSPFYIVTRLKKWETENNKPRLAGVSSFGFSGTNAHVVLEEYVAQASTYETQEPAVVVLSARSADRLREQVANLLNYINRNPDADIHSIAYTLQTGRDAMEHRLGIVVADLAALSNELRRYMAGDQTGLLTGVVRGAVAASTKGLLPPAQRATQWVMGTEIDWSTYYKEAQPAKLSLPGYPFTRERYWIDASPSPVINQPVGMAVIHPLVHHNHSSLEQQRYQSIFTGRERFLSDHVIEGKKVFPGAAYLELARAAGSHSLEKLVTQLRDVVWLTPLVVNGDLKELQISIYREGDDTGYEIYTGAGESEELHSQGRLLNATVQKLPSWDVSHLRAGYINRLAGEACYGLFKELGFDYGASHRGIEELWYKEGSALSRIRLIPEPGYELSTGMVDSVLQSCLGVVLGAGTGKLERQVPYSAGEITLYAPVQEEVWCYVRGRGGQVASYDIDVMNDSGEVLLAIRDFVALVAGKNNAELSIASNKSAKAPALSYYQIQWVTKQADAVQENAPSSQSLILLAGGSAELADLLTSRLETEVEILSSANATDYFLEVLESLKPRMKGKGNTTVIVLYEQSSYTDHSFITGLLRTAQQEHPGIKGKTVSVPALSVMALETLVPIIEAELEQDAEEVRYINGLREVLELLPVQDITSSAITIKDGGVYLLTGGGGGLGSLFATHLSKLKTGRLILTGRSELSAEKAAFVSSLGIATYYRCDVSVREDVAQLFAKIKNEYGSLNGIIHAAGVIRDSFIIHKQAAEVGEVFAGKVLSTRNLDELSREEALDFMVLFSSVSGVLGNVGQGDYASANAWLDRYALHRNELVRGGQRKGQTVSINWPLWSGVGMQPDEASRKRLEQEWGLLPLPAEEGLRVFDKALNSGLHQVIVTYGYNNKITEVLSGEHNLKETALLSSYNESPSTTPQWLQEAAHHFIKKEVASVLKLPVGKLETDEAFERYGINSLLVARLTNHLDGIFGRLPRTLFFEYQNLRDLVGYFLSEHSSKLEALTSRGERLTENDAAQFTPAVSQATTIPRILRRSKQLPATQNTKTASTAVAPIAIIGVSGRYPGARDINAFWEQLHAGRDCITEIPGDRWDLTGFYDPDKDRRGRSYGKWGGFIDDVASFDPLFFNISPRDAEFLDPQERLFLQTAWETIEDAGYTRSSLESKGAVGVYVGVMYEEYQLFGAEETAKGNPLTLSGSAASIANRVSYFMNLHGPSMAVDTMCSSSLTSIHLACESLRTGSIKMALAGGVNISVHPNKYRLLSERRFMSEKGRCESFGEGGEGYVPGEGVGAVLLKPLDAAIADGDRIYGVIRGSSINHGGKTNGYTVPNPVMQSEVIRTALEQGGIKAEEVSYIEAHGTGTSLGDPIEIAGLSKIFGSATSGRVCAIGSVKSNIGHCESAAGIAGVTKVLLQMEHKQLVPSLHSEKLNVNIDFERTSFRVQQELANWEAAEGCPRMAGVSSFGAGGSNAHVIIEEYIPAAKATEAVKPTTGEVLILLSAKQESQLNEQVTNLLEYLQRKGDAAVLEEMAYTLQTGREAMEERLAIQCRNLTELIDRLQSYSLLGAIGQEGIYRGNTRMEKETIELVLSGSEGAGYLEILLQNKRLVNLAQLWVKGAAVNWQLLYLQRKPRKTALPTYPFERTKYWFPQIEQKQNDGILNGQHKLSLLLDNIQNGHITESDFVLALEAGK